MTVNTIPTIRVYHHSLWARYKGAIFTRMHSNSEGSGVSTSFVHVAETDGVRVALGGVDRSYHRYPYELLFAGSYDDTPLRRRIARLVVSLFRNPSDLVIMPGYNRAEHWAMLFACMILRRKRAVFVDSTAYDRKKSSLKEAAKRFFFRRCDGFICYGIRSKEYVASYGIDERKIIHRCQAAALPHDYDVAAIRSYYKTRFARADPAPRFLYIGRLSAEKGLCDLLDAFADVLKRIPDAKLDIVGSGTMDRELKERTTRSGLDYAVTFCGVKTPEQIGQLIMRSVALVLPSHSEPWGLVVNESLSFGCPVVVSNICGCVPELVVDGETGFTFPSGNVQALGVAMLAAAALDRPAAAMRCLDLINQYSSDDAASQILTGCISILKSAA